MTDINEAQWLEVVAWMVCEDGSAEQEPLCRLSDATAVIDQQARRIELLDENSRQLRERVAELEESNRSWVLRIQQRGIEMDEMSQLIEDQAAELAALKSSPVVMPEWATSSEALGQRLLDAGWRDYADAQWDGVKEIFAELNRSKT